ncbi:MAG: sodium/proline symporter PutP [Halomonadaceae bacterium]|nr:MAG: sodium/proline symporter PutP [Halomonadaceae bacterium]
MEVENLTVVTLTFVVYIVGMLALGLVAYMRTQNLADYVLGGRNLGPIPSALSAGASDMSGWLLLGLPGYAYAAGFEAIWIAVGLLVGTWLNWLVVARRLRNYSAAAKDSLTIPSYLENRFNDTSRVLRVIAAFFILLFFLFYTSAGLVAGGKLFETVFEMPYQWAVIVGTVAVVSYTLFGGFLAVSWTDVVQGLLMMAALALVPVLAISDAGGWNSVTAAMGEENSNFLNMFTDDEGRALGFVAIASLLAWGLGYFGQPHILARFKAISSEDKVPYARRIAVSWSAITLLGSLLVGFAAIGFFDVTVEDGETVFMLLVNALFHPVVSGILLAAILAAVMSTADSQLLVCSSALAEDFYKGFFRKEASQSELVMVGRVAVVVIALIAAAVAMDDESMVLDLVSYAWAGFGAAFGPAIILSLYWRRMNRNGALAGVLVGGITVVLWDMASGGLFDIYEILPGFIFSAIAIVVVSLATGRPEEAIERQFDKMDPNHDS